MMAGCNSYLSPAESGGSGEGKASVLKSIP